MHFARPDCRTQPPMPGQPRRSTPALRAHRVVAPGRCTPNTPPALCPSMLPACRRRAIALPSQAARATTTLGYPLALQCPASDRRPTVTASPPPICHAPTDSPSTPCMPSSAQTTAHPSPASPSCSYARPLAHYSRLTHGTSLRRAPIRLVVHIDARRPARKPSRTTDAATFA